MSSTPKDKRGLLLQWLNQTRWEDRGQLSKQSGVPSRSVSVSGMPQPQIPEVVLFGSLGSPVSVLVSSFFVKSADKFMVSFLYSLVGCKALGDGDNAGIDTAGHCLGNVDVPPDGLVGAGPNGKG